ncbi:MAG: hypothetical protein PHO02_04330 [Candidatus Nanoarchaeia archaeon]|nr:hypothetical protein [Candidatus Nanoarchaeia archaeon]
MNIINKTLEEMKADGEIIDFGEVVIEEENQEMPVLVLYIPPKVIKKQAPLEDMVEPLSFHNVRAEDAQRRLRTLPDYLFGKAGLGYKAARLFGITTERDRLDAFGKYFADSLDGRRYLNPAQFLVKAEIAIINVKSGKEGERPIRKSIRKALSGKDEKVYDSIREKLPQIARAVATTGFAVEVADIYRDADKTGKTPFEYAKDIRRERQLDDLAKRIIYGSNNNGMQNKP